MKFFRFLAVILFGISILFFNQCQCTLDCISSISGTEWLEDEGLQVILDRVYFQRETVTLVNGEYDKNYDFNVELKEDLKSYEPNIPGMFYPWDEVKEIVLGRLEGAGVPELDPALLGVIHFLPSEMEIFVTGRNPEYLQTKGKTEIEDFETFLKNRDINVHRPEKFDFTKPMEGLYSEGYCNMQARDSILVVGNHFIPSRFAWKSRAMEVSTFEPILELAEKLGATIHRMEEPKRERSAYNLHCLDEELRVFLDEEVWHDKDCKWDNVTTTVSKFDVLELSKMYCPGVSNEEVFFDAPDCSPIGNDVWCQLSQVTNLKGLEYISKELGPLYRVHILPLIERNAMHIDTHFVPLKNKLVMIDTNLLRIEDLPKYFDDWEVIHTPSPRIPLEEYPFDLFYSGVLNNNILVLNDHTVVVQPNEPNTKEMLESHGFNTIPIPLFYSSNPLDGGPHCATAEFWRDGTPHFENEIR